MTPVGQPERPTQDWVITLFREFAALEARLTRSCQLKQGMMQELIPEMSWLA